MADEYANAVIAANLITGDRTIISDDTTGSGAEFQRITGIGLDSDNNRALVSEFFPPSIMAVDLTTGNRSYFSDNAGAGSGPALVIPGDIKVDPTSGVIYVGDEGPVGDPGHRPAIRRSGDPDEIARHKKRPSTRTAFSVSGAGNQVRTGDLNLGKVALYQLSYSRDGPRF